MAVALTIKIDESLKRAGAQRARENHQTLTALIHYALRRTLNEVCPTCGSDRRLPPGGELGFERFFSLYARSPVYLVSCVDGTTRVWKGRLWRMDERTVTLAPMTEGKGKDAIFLRDHIVHFEEADNDFDARVFEDKHPALPRVEAWGRE